MINTTIAAVSTPHGKGGVAVIRISGPETVAVLDRCFVAASGKKTEARGARLSCFGTVTDAKGEVIDTALAVWFKAPKSYTGEDVAEIACHGGIAVTKAVLSAVFQAGAVPAGPGEFTRRAFAAGKLSLSEAEAVGLLIDADTESRRKLSSAVSLGGLSRRIDEIASMLTDNLSALWAAIDYPEEEVGEEGFEHLGETICRAKAGIMRLLATYKAGAAVVGGVQTVICGSPNVGKSTLYNALCGEEKAIVTNIPGTTRDILETTVDRGGVTLRLYDTAGLREAKDEVEKIGIKRAQEIIDRADLILGVLDVSEGHEELCEDILQLKRLKEQAPQATFIGVINKCDSGSQMETDKEKELAEICDRIVHVSAQSEEGIEPLLRAISELYETEKLNEAGGAVLWNETQKASLEKALGCLEEAEQGLQAGAPVDVLGVLAETALAELLRTDGRGVSEEIVDQIFARFCVGK